MVENVYTHAYVVYHKMYNRTCGETASASIINVDGNNTGP